jgi:hypothetical protein
MRHTAAARAGAALALLLGGGAMLLSGCSSEQPPAISVPAADDEPPTPTWSTPRSFSLSSSAETPPPPSAPVTTVPEGIASTPPPSAGTVPPAPTATPNASGKITFYGARDNEPAGSRAIAFTNVLHKQAGGTGTFQDPLTFAAGQGQFRLGTKIYVPDVRRYFILEDLCSGCDNGQVHLWAGPATDSGLVACEKSLTRDGARPYQVDPPAGLPVVAGDLYTNGHCYRP